MTPILRKLFGLNWILFLVMVALAAFGVYAIYGATWMRDVDFWRRQLLWSVLSLVAFFGAALIDYRWIRWGAVPVYLGGLFLLVLTRFIGLKVNGARSWLDLKVMSFQPAHLAIIGGIMVLALVLSEFKRFHPMLRLTLCGALCGAPALLILLQPDLGETIMWGPVLLAMLFVGGIQLRYLICILLIGLAMVPLAINFGLKPYQRDRITAFLDPDLDPQGAGWAINQCLIAVGSAGWDGKGFKAPDSQVALGFVPSTAAHNDFIFSSITETHGFIGGAALLGAFAALTVICLFIAYRAEDELGLLLAVGFTALIFAHVFQNIGMNIAVTPITGVPMPLVSYSGSFLLIIMSALGVLESIWIHRKSYR